MRGNRSLFRDGPLLWGNEKNGMTQGYVRWLLFYARSCHRYGIRCTTRGVTRSIHLNPYLSAAELAIRYRRTPDPVERSHWRFLWLMARGFTAKAIASMTGYSAYWIGQIARRCNARGPDGVKDQRRLAGRHRQLLTVEQHSELRAALYGPAPQYDRWTGRTVAAWMAQRLGRPNRRR
jgi:hypothetical protein